MTKYKVLLLGAGGREHAIAQKITESPLLEALYIAPGNGGTALLGQNIALDLSNFESLAAFVLEKDINMLFVGPEDPLVAGIQNYFAGNPQFNHVHIIGPSKEGAMLEGSKAFAKAFMQKNQIPTAKYQKVTKGSIQAGWDFLETLHPPYVLKADGLAAGKGVLILQDLEEAKQTLKAMLFENLVGKAGDEVVIEEFLTGTEVSFFICTDGKDYVLLPEAKDYKRIGEGDTGANTGGMGAISPVPFVDAAFKTKVVERIIKPTLHGIQQEGINYNGFIFFGLIKVDADPFVIEYNCRMGDPETEVVFPRIKSDVLALFAALKNGDLSKYHLEIDPNSHACVMAVSGGYPANYETGFPITGIEQVNGSSVFQAGTTLKDTHLYTNGGRVLAVSSNASSLQEALAKSYAGLAQIHYDYQYFRKDIGWEFV